MKDDVLGTPFLNNRINRNILEVSRNLLLDIAPELSKQIDEVLISTLDTWIKMTLPPQIVGQIIAHLTAIGEQALSEGRREQGQLAIVRTLIKHWIDCTEKLMFESETPSKAFH